jgi:hypothetical protein
MVVLMLDFWIYFLMDERSALDNFQQYSSDTFFLKMEFSEHFQLVEVEERIEDILVLT